MVAVVQDDWQYKDIHAIVREQAERYTTKVYIESPDQGKNITFPQAAEWCNRIASFLKQQGIRANDRIATIGENTIESLILFLGVLNYGAIITPINVEESKENIYSILQHAKPRIVFHGQELTFDKERYRANLWIPYSYSGIGSEQTNEFFSSLKRYSPVFENPVGNKNDIALTVFTSGTTAIPKAVLCTRESFFYMVLDTIDRLHITDKDVILDYRAYNWESPQLLSILPSLMTGATLVYAKGFSRSRLALWLKDYGVTVSAGVPTVINMLLEREIPLHKRDIPTLRFMTSSSAPLLVKNQLMFEEKYGILVNQFAGSSETGQIAMNDPEDMKQPKRRRFGSIGKAVKYKDVFVVDEQGSRLKPGQEGEIVVRGKSMGLGYLQPDGTTSKFPEDGFRTGDLGHIDEEGYIFITGRIKNQVVRGGVKISPAEITEWIMEYPAVQVAETIGVPDKVYGEDVVSFVIPKEGSRVTKEELIVHCKKKLPDFKMPKAIYFLKEFPTGATGKISKQCLLKIWGEKQQKRSEGAQSGANDKPLLK